MIEIKNVSFFYAQGQKENGLQDINLAILPGEVILLCGESGCGKTTLTRLLNGLIPNYYEGELTGEVLINGHTVNELPLYKTSELVGSVFQNPRSQFFNVDTTSELAFGCENKGLPEAEIKARIDETVSDLKIESLMNRSIFKLSGGEKQKIACASVSACRPEIFVLDEPSSNLDTSATRDLRELIAVWKEKGRTIIIAEHRLYYLRELADRIVYMKNGRIEKEFTAETVKKMSDTELSFMGLRPLHLDAHKKSEAVLSDEQDTLTISNFIFSYKGQPPAIDISSLSLPTGSVVAIIGPNGAGKSTFARCLCGLNKQCNGTITLHGRICKNRQRLKYCYMVMQDVNHQLFTESVLDEVLLGMEKPDPQEADDILAALDLLQFREKHPMSLSGGQKQRVAIASAVSSGKEIIVFDEPTSGLDLKHMREVSENIKKLQKAGKTLLVISHDLEFILQCCTWVLYLMQGQVQDLYQLNENGQNKVISFFGQKKPD